MIQKLSLIDTIEGDEYKEFVEKFKPKKTTDDCYTPEPVYEVVLNYCIERYGIDRNNVMRPFYPGGDFEHEVYSRESVVIDNPPFSIISKICRFYCNNGIKFFLFAPSLTNLGICPKMPITHIICGAGVEYDNGAIVLTSFVTNLGDTDVLAESEPHLLEKIENAVKETKSKTVKKLPKYSYPDSVISSSDFQYLSNHGTAFKVMRKDTFFIRSLDEQKKGGKSVFGGGYLLSKRAAAERAAAERAAAERAAAERAAAERWSLSDRELEIQRRLGR